MWNMWSQRIKGKKNIATKYIEYHRVKKRYQTNTVFLSDYLALNTGQRYLLSKFEYFSKFECATLMHTKTRIEILNSFNEFLKPIGKPYIL